MDNTKDSVFLTIPHEVLVDLFYLLPTSSVLNLYSVSSAHLRLFDTEHGIWQKLTRKIFKWYSNAWPSQTQGATPIVDWKKEYRVASYFDSSIRDSQVRPVAAHTDLSSLQTLAKNHFKAENTVPNIENMSYCTLQSQIKLYPLPVGNFSTAYYEVEAVNIDDSSFDFAIGGAIKGFIGMVGTGITSYGYSILGAIHLECELTPEEPLEECKIANGDIVGFGINFVNKSVFFTKNGKLIHEANKNFDDKPLLELMNLHATITMDRHEVKVNMGSAPFEFDLLKYQQQHAQRPLELYSNVVMEHLLSAVELTDEVLEDTNLYYNDNNIPDFECKLPEVFYILLYCRLPPNSKYFNNDAIYHNEMMSQMTSLRFLLNSANIMQNMKSDQTRQAKMMITGFIKEHQIENASSMPWDEQVTTVCYYAMHLFNRFLFNVVDMCVDEIAEWTYSKGQMPLWTRYLHAAYEFSDTDRWVKEFVLPFLNTNETELDDIDAAVYADIYAFKVNLAATSVLAQRCKHMAKVKADERDLMMIVFGKNSNLASGYEQLINALESRGNMDPVNDYSVEPDENAFKICMQMEARLVIDEDENADPLSVVLYGIYYLKISPEDFESMEDYVRAVFKQNKKLITNNMKLAFLLRMLEVTKLSEEEEGLVETEYFQNMTLLPLKALFSINITMEGDSKRTIKRAKKEIERLLQIRFALAKK